MYKAKNSRYSKDIYANVGNSGLRLPKVSLGLWHNFGGKFSFKNMKEMCFSAFDNGITHFDLANNYGPPPGSAESNFGKIINGELKSYRDEIIVSTKAGYTMWDGPYGKGGSRKYLISSLDQSLKRLNLPYVDIFYHHCMDKSTPLEETMLALWQIVKSGKALYIGLSNYDGETLKQANAILTELKVPFIINQNVYNMVNREVEKNGLLAQSKSEGKGVICFSPLAQGLLTNRYLNGIPSDSRAVTDGRFLKKDSLTKERLENVSKLNLIAKERGQTLAQMALSWLLRNDAVTSVLIGASKKEQILENLNAVKNVEFTAQELEKIDEYSSKL